MPHDPKITPLFITTEPVEIDGYLHVEVGDEVLDGFRGREDETRQDPQAQRVVESTMRHYRSRFGAAAQRELERELWQAMTWVRTQYDPSRGRFTSLAESVKRTVLRRFYRDHKPKNLRRELDDQTFREQARRDDAALVRYLAQWKKRLEKLQRGHHKKGRWSVPGLRADEIRDHLELDLLAAVKNREIEDPEFSRVGSESTFIYLAKRLDKLKRGRFFVDILSYNFGSEDDGVTALAQHAPSAEVLAIHRDAVLVAEEIFARASELGLSRTQMRWLKAFMLEARGTALHNTKFNAARVAENMSRGRASASRMLKTIGDKVSARYGAKEDLLP